MKRLIALLVALFFVVPGYAQLKEKGFFVEMDGAYGRYEKYSYSQSFMVIGPSLGYKINPRWSVGAKMLFETAGFNYATFGIYSQYYYWNRSRFGAFIDFQASCGWSRTGIDTDNSGKGADGVFGEVGFALGASYALSDHFAILLRYPYIGYNSGYFERDYGATAHVGDFIVDGNWKRLQLGVRYLF